ncbi:MAG: glycosyltransferase, partial [Patescibacteria group bacterium]
MAKFRIGIECESIEGNNPMWGVGKMLFKLLEELSHRSELEKSHRFVLYFKDNVPDFDFLKTPIFEIKRVPVPFFKNRLFPIYYFALLPMRLWFDRPDVMFWPNYMLPIIAFGKSMVTLTEDVYYEAHDGKLPFRYRLAYLIFCWWAANFATKIMAISETSKKNLVKLYGIKPERVFVNYLGVDLLPSFAKATEGRQREDNYLLFVGQMFPRRHAKETILAFEKLLRQSSGQVLTDHSQILKNLRMNELKLILIGPDKYPEPVIGSLAKQINEKLRREAIIHKDYVSEEELRQLYANAGVLVYISDREAFGLPPMEALSFGVPPVVMDNDLGHELFGEYAFYAKSGSVDDVAEAIKEAIGNEPRI